MSGTSPACQLAASQPASQPASPDRQLVH
jgi:hypothetical protein